MGWMGVPDFEPRVPLYVCLSSLIDPCFSSPLVPFSLFSSTTPYSSSSSPFDYCPRPRIKHDSPYRSCPRLLRTWFTFLSSFIFPRRHALVSDHTISDV